MCKYIDDLNRTRDKIARWNADQARAHFGADHVAWILSHPNAAAVAEGRAWGCWFANLLEEESAYNRLAALIRAGEVA